MQNHGNMLQQTISALKTKELIYKFKSIDIHQHHGIVFRFLQQCRKVCDKAVPVISTGQKIFVRKLLKCLVLLLQKAVNVKKQDSE